MCVNDWKRSQELLFALMFSEWNMIEIYLYESIETAKVKFLLNE